MKILKKGVMQDGTDIQIEDWSKDYSIYAYASTVAAYPRDRYGKRFRAEKDFKNNSEAEQAFEQLIDGSKSLKDCKFVTMISSRHIPYETQL